MGLLRVIIQIRNSMLKAGRDQLLASVRLSTAWWESWKREKNRANLYFFRCTPAQVVCGEKSRRLHHQGVIWLLIDADSWLEAAYLAFHCIFREHPPLSCSCFVASVEKAKWYTLLTIYKQTNLIFPFQQCLRAIFHLPLQARQGSEHFLWAHRHHQQRNSQNGLLRRMHFSFSSAKWEKNGMISPRPFLEDPPWAAACTIKITLNAVQNGMMTGKTTLQCFTKGRLSLLQLLHLYTPTTPMIGHSNREFRIRKSKGVFFGSGQRIY